MTTQQKINDLANAAIRTGETAASRSSSSAAVSKAIASAAAAAPARSPKSSQIDAELRASLDVRDVKMKKKQNRTRWTINLVLLGLLCSGGTWAAVTPSAREKIGAVVKAFQESKGDIQSMGHILGVYDKQLDQIAVQGARVDAATRALGVDPNKVVDDGGLDLNAEMKKMAGGPSSGPTSIERDQKVQEKFGVISKLAGRDPSKVKAAAESDVKF